MLRFFITTPANRTMMAGYAVPGIMHLTCIGVALFVLSILCSCNDSYSAYTEEHVIEAPKGFPPVPYPVDNVPNAASVELGRWLFYDAGLSGDGSVACASCHQQSFAFSDTVPVSIGMRGENGSRNAPPIINVAYQASWFWDGRARTLEDQIHAALTGPAEMSAHESHVVQYLTSDTMYLRLYAEAFGSTSEVSLNGSVKALATFCRSLLSGNSRYDRFLYGERGILNDEEQRGMKIFFGEKSGCSSCHSGFNFSDQQYHSIALHVHYYDRGRYYVTRNEKDIGKFKTPTLRNVALTAPYTNEGMFRSLTDIVDHYNRGGQPFVYRDTSRIRPLNLDESERRALIAFLGTLTDEQFLRNPGFRNPFR